MTLPERITTYITKHYPISYDRLMHVATAKGFTPFEVEEALQRVHKDKTIRVLTASNGDLMYAPAPVQQKKEPGSHLTWVRKNYPKYDPWCVDAEGKMIIPFPEINMSYLFLSPSEMKEYKAVAKGMPVHMYNRGNGNTRGKDTKSHPRRAY